MTQITIQQPQRVQQVLRTGTNAQRTQIYSWYLCTNVVEVIAYKWTIDVPRLFASTHMWWNSPLFGSILLFLFDGEWVAEILQVYFSCIFTLDELALSLVAHHKCFMTDKNFRFYKHARKSHCSEITYSREEIPKLTLQNKSVTRSSLKTLRTY